MKYINYTVEDFVKDEYFQKWVLNPDSMTERFWKNWLTDNPHKRAVIKKSKRLVLLMDFDDDKLSNEDFDAMWRNIIERRSDTQKDIQLPRKVKASKEMIFLRVAAVFIGIVVTGLGLYMSGVFDPSKGLPQATDSQITLELEDGTIRVLDETSSKVLTNAEGRAVVRQEQNTLVYEEKETDSLTLEYNKLTVPYGKKFDLVLSDGSHVFLNSGSKLRYPVSFSKELHRDVYLDGEAYFSIERDEARPFTVITDEMNTQVYGTEFNVSSYKNENNTSTVLVEGSVGVYKSNNGEASKPIVIEEGQRAIFHNDSIAIEKANVNKYIAWKEGKLLFVDDRFDLILKELERHFDVKIINNFTKLNEKKFTGTFEKEPLDRILRICQEHTPFDYYLDGDTITISRKENTTTDQ